MKSLNQSHSFRVQRASLSSSRVFSRFIDGGPLTVCPTLKLPNLSQLRILCTPQHPNRLPNPSEGENKGEHTHPHPFTMSRAMAPSSDAGFMTSDGPARTPRAGRLPSSSARAPAPPSDSLGALSDGEGEGFADDEVPVRARPTDPANIPRVEDKIGLIIQDHFERFIEGCVAAILGIIMYSHLTD